MNTKRNVYLNMKPLEEARQILFDHFPGTGTMAAETVSPPDAVGACPGPNRSSQPCRRPIFTPALPWTALP